MACSLAWQAVSPPGEQQRPAHTHTHTHIHTHSSRCMRGLFAGGPAWQAVGPPGEQRLTGTHTGGAVFPSCTQLPQPAQARTRVAHRLGMVGHGWAWWHTGWAWLGSRLKHGHGWAQDSCPCPTAVKGKERLAWWARAGNRGGLHAVPAHT